MPEQRVEQPHLLLIDGDESFLEDVSERTTEGEVAVSTLAASSVEEIIKQLRTIQIPVSVVAIGDKVDDLRGTIERISNETELPVVLLTEQIKDEGAIEEAIEAGALGYFPRVSTPAQYDLIGRTVVESTWGDAPDNGDQASEKDDWDAHQRNEEYEVIFENVQDALFLIDVNRAGDGTEFVYRRLTDPREDPPGPPSEELEGLNPQQAFGPEQGAEMEQNYRRCLETRDTITYEERIERPSGISIWRTKLSPVIVNDEVTHIVGSARDITDEKQREETLESFHDATRKLTEADSREAVCERAVRAAEEILNFPLVSVHLYDDQSGDLPPVAATTRLEELETTLPTIEPGDSLPWQVYIEEESAKSSTMDVPIYGPGVSDPELILSLGSHGVMLVGAPDETFDPADIELVQILAATLEAGLNHVAGERELENREQELRKYQNRAERFEQLNDIIRDIERATIEQSSRADIEEAVCDRLVSVDEYDVVWIAEPGVGNEELKLQTNAGTNPPYIDSLTNRLAFETSEHPAIRAHVSGAPQSINNIATDVSGGEWRTAALRHGIQSILAVPIQHDTRTHGVMTIASETPGRFTDATRNVLAELGRSIGYAISMAERERALESEATTELEFTVDDDGLFLIRASSKAGCRVVLERNVRRVSGSFSTFYAIEGVEPEDVISLAETAAGVEETEILSSDEHDVGGLIEITGQRWFGSVFAEHGAVIQEATAENGEGTLVVEVPRGANIRALVDGFRERYPDSELVAKRQRERSVSSLFELQNTLRHGLTDRQWEVLETAYSAGYFEWPRETSGQEAAELLDVSQPTFNKHLRTAERVAFKMLLDREYPEEAD